MYDIWHFKGVFVVHLNMTFCSQVMSVEINDLNNPCNFSLFGEAFALAESCHMVGNVFTWKKSFLDIRKYSPRQNMSIHKTLLSGPIPLNNSFPHIPFVLWDNLNTKWRFCLEYITLNRTKQKSQGRTGTNISFFLINIVHCIQDYTTVNNNGIPLRYIPMGERERDKGCLQI